jgi:hypothetical protein
MYDDEDISVVRQQQFVKAISILKKITIIVWILAFLYIVSTLAYEYYPKFNQIKILQEDVKACDFNIERLNKIIKNGQDKQRVYNRHIIINTFKDALSDKDFSFIDSIKLKTQIQKDGLLINNVIIYYKPKIINSKSRMLALLDTIYHIKGVTKIIDFDKTSINVVYEMRK